MIGCTCPNRTVGGRSLLSLTVVLGAVVLLAASSTRAQYQVRKPVAPGQEKVGLTITDPAGAVTWEKGKRYTIRWTSEGAITAVEIVLMDQDGRSHDVIRRTANSGSYTYSVARTVADGAYLLKVISADGQVTAESNGLITIQPATAGGAGLSPTPVSRPPSGGYTPRTPAPTGETRPGTVTAGTEDRSPSGTPGLQQSPLTTAPAQTQQEARQLSLPVDVSGFTYPDLQIENLLYAEPLDRVVVHLRNYGLAYSGQVEMKVVALVGREGSRFTYDSTVAWQVDLDPGELDVRPLPGFDWPDPIDHPRLTFGLNLDPQNLIAEQDEGNNRFDATLGVPCGMRIDSIAPNSISHGEGGMSTDIELYGRFGDERYGKVIQLVRNNVPTRPDIWHWSDSKVIIHVPDDLSTGTHTVAAYCSDPVNASAYASNGVRFTKEAQSRSDKFKAFVAKFLASHHSSPLDAGSIAEALADEFGDWLDFGCLSPEVDSIKVGPSLDGQGIDVYARYTSHCPCLIVHEVWQGDQSVKLWPVGLNGDKDPREALQVFPDLEPGIYQYTFRVVNSDEQEASASVSFEHK